MQVDYTELAELLFPQIKKTIADYDLIYPLRQLPQQAEVVRFAPSPTGRIHLGNLFASFIPEVFARQSKGIFILRIEDTDDKRAIENGTELILSDLASYDYQINEDPLQGGIYGPYIQSQRKDIYGAFAKHLVATGRAYPCFCQEEELEMLRSNQEANKERIGYYGSFARCRNLGFTEIKELLARGERYVIRLKSLGDFNEKLTFTDCIKGVMELNKNDIDHVLLKSDGMPTYNFAHIVDDYLMRITVITRDDAYISSVPFHLEIWEALGLQPPRFAHILPISVKEKEVTRKLSKRKDPEAAISYYHEKGVPKEAIKLYFAILLNSNFEEWHLLNPTKDYHEFEFSFTKMSKSPPLFDKEKLENISRNFLASISALDLYERLLKWTEEFDQEFYELLIKYRQKSIDILNIERQQVKPRKDFSCYSEIKANVCYMYDELFPLSELGKAAVKEFYKREILEDYLNNVYDENDDSESWFTKIKYLCPKYNFASNVKEYKADPAAYVGSIGDFCELLRVAVTGRTVTPDLYQILQILGRERLKERFTAFSKYLK